MMRPGRMFCIHHHISMPVCVVISVCVYVIYVVIPPFHRVLAEVLVYLNTKNDGTDHQDRDNHIFKASPIILGFGCVLHKKGPLNGLPAKRAVFQMGINHETRHRERVANITRGCTWGG